MTYHHKDGGVCLVRKKQKIVHSQESLWQNKNLPRGKKKKKNTEFSLSPGIICLPVLHNAFSHPHTQSIPETVLDTGKSKTSQESVLKSLQVPGKDTGMKQLGHLRSVSSRIGRAQDQDCQGSESSQSSLHGPAPEQSPKDMVAGMRRRASVISELYIRKVSDPRSCQNAGFCGKIWPAQRLKWEDSQRPDVTSDRLPWHMGKLLVKSLQCKHASLSASSLGSVYKFSLSLR